MSGAGRGGLEQGKTSHHWEYSQHGEAVSEWCGEGGGASVNQD